MGRHRAQKDAEERNKKWIDHLLADLIVEYWDVNFLKGRAQTS